MPGRPSPAAQIRTEREPSRMAHAVTASSTPPLRSNEPLNADSVRRARVDLAACLRWAARNGLEKGSATISRRSFRSGRTCSWSTPTAWPSRR